MLNQNHPDDERLSALASHDTDATADVMLTAHVSSCDRCTELVDALGALRVALADLPDLRPSRPLQLIPPVETEHAADRLGGWARRFFAPVLAAGAALALVGTVGTAAPVLDQMASGPATGGADTAARQELAQPEASAAGEEPAAAESTMDALGADGGEVEGASPLVTDYEAPAPSDGSTQPAEADEAVPLQPASAERSPWPMVLFAGVALMVAAAALRWILVPRG